MNELMTMGKEITMDSREIAELTNKRHADVIRDIETQIGSIVDERRFASVYKGGNGEERKCYLLPYRETMILVSGYSVGLRAKVVDRWMELEKGAKLPDFSNPAIAARAWADQYEARVKAEVDLKVALPKAEFYDAVTGSPDTIDMKNVAKVLNMGIGRNKLFALLRGYKVLMNRNEPYQKYVDNGCFRIVESKFTLPSGDVGINLKTVVYQKGVDFIRKLVQKAIDDGTIDKVEAIEE